MQVLADLLPVSDAPGITFESSLRFSGFQASMWESAVSEGADITRDVLLAAFERHVQVLAHQLGAGAQGLFFAIAECRDAHHTLACNSGNEFPKERKICEITLQNRVFKMGWVEHRACNETRA